MQKEVDYFNEMDRNPPPIYVSDFEPEPEWPKVSSIAGGGYQAMVINSPIMPIISNLQI